VTAREDALLASRDDSNPVAFIVAREYQQKEVTSSKTIAKNRNELSEAQGYFIWERK